MRVRIFNDDGRLFIKKTSKKYDAILIGIGQPTTAKTNRFYTIEFFKEVRKVLNNGGVLALRLSSEENYLDEDILKLNSVIYNSLREVFPKILIIPSTFNYYIASEKKLDYNITGRLEYRNITTTFVNEGYLIDILSPSRIEYIYDSLDKDAGLNSDFKPIAYYHHMNHWLRLLDVNKSIFLTVILLFLFLAYLKLDDIEACVFTIGFSGMTFEILLIIVFQIMFGIVYSMIGFLISCFMIGIVFGGYIVSRKIEEFMDRPLHMIPFIAMCYSLIILPIFYLIGLVGSVRMMFLITWFLFPILTIIAGFLVGVTYPMCVAKKSGKGNISVIVGRLSSIDFAGAFLGAMLSATFLIPFYGIGSACLIIAGFNLISGLRLFKRWNQY